MREMSTCSVKGVDYSDEPTNKISYCRFKDGGGKNLRERFFKPWTYKTKTIRYCLRLHLR